MNWSDEKYVKVYSRDTLTWRSWGWQARTVFLHLTRKLDGAGLIEVGRMDPVDALALQLDLPREVVAAGLPQILETGTAELVQGAVLVPNWVEAQEATKFEAAKKRDQRARARDQRRAVQATEIRQTVVPACPGSSQLVPACPPPAQPSPAQPIVVADKPPPDDLQLFEPPVVPTPPKAPKERKASVHEAWWAKAQAQAAKLKPDRVGERLQTSDLNVVLKPIRDEVGEVGLDRAWAAYLANAYARDHGWPLRLFAAQWRQHHNVAPKLPAVDHPQAAKVY